MAKIGFIGSANALGMMYALELRDAGHDVVYFVTTSAEDVLSRPECFFDEVPFPYPDWIVERLVLHPLRANIAPSYYVPDLLGRLSGCDFVFVSGVYLMLAPFLRRSKVYFLSHGSDLDVWCRRESIKFHLHNFLKWKSPIGSLFSAFAVFAMRRAFRYCDYLITFPSGLSRVRDEVVSELVKDWRGRVVDRFDVSFRALRGVSRVPSFNKDKLVILCAVRCSFLPEDGVSPSDLKGVDVIIRGVGKYVSMNRLPVEFHIVEKGKDLQLAKRICHEVGLDKCAVWHKEMPFRKLVELYELSDVCFDQVADSWLGAVGIFALYLGRPLVANPRSDVLGKEYSEYGRPIMEARSEGEVVDCLIELESVSFRQNRSVEATRLAEGFFGPAKVLAELGFGCEKRH